MNKKRKQDAEASFLSRACGRVLKGMRLSVKWIMDKSGLGYTSMGNRNSCAIHVAWDDGDIMKDMSEEEKSVFRTGVAVHETLHQCFTNFMYTNKMAQSMSRAEASVFMKFANTLEDPAIEFFAGNVFGGYMLDALKYTIVEIYKKSPPIDESPNAFIQLINALVNFGDMGIVKGNFTFPEAKEYFQKIAPLYNEGIECPDSKRRIDIAKECMEISRPLWEEDVKNEELFEQLLKELMESIEKMGAHILKDMEDSMKGDESSKTSKSRKLAVESLEKSDDSKEDKSDNAADITDKADSTDKSDGSESKADSTDKSDGSESKADSAKSKTDNASTESKADSTESESKTDSESKKSDESDDSDESDEESSGIEKDSEEADEIAEDSYDISEDSIENIRKSIEDIEKEMEKDSSSDSKGGDILPDYDFSSDAFTKKNVVCVNRKMNVESALLSMENLYKEEVVKYEYDIKVFAKTLEKLFNEDMATEVRATSGSYNIKRGSIGTTARIFDKRRDKGNVKDAKVFIAVDLSGSMSGSKIYNARRTAIILAEALTRVNVPYYIMGFTADCYGGDAVHNHYVDWNNKKTDRYSLITMEAGGNNFDGYSIRYAAEMLRKQSATNKILFVISDGEPACRGYKSYAQGITDTKDTIRIARKDMTVFGIALGRGCSPEMLQDMYGMDFIHCQDETLLTNILCKKLVKTLKKNM